MKRKKICWITPDYFLIVDAPKVPHLIKDFDIEWILINTYNTNRKTDGLLTEKFRPREYNLKYRQKDPRIIFQYLSLLLMIRKMKPDLIYISFHGFPFFLPLLLMFFNADKVVWGVHNVRTPKGASNSGFMDIYQNYVFKRIKNIHVFSEFQLGVAKELFPEKKHFFIPLTLEDYGNSDVLPPDKFVRFLFFGYIKEYKGLDILIRSFGELKDSGLKNIELFIAGKCDNWEYYNTIINGDTGIKTRIESIPNNEIPDIISSCHYVVLPYRDSAQSGVLNLAYQYNKPVIASDIEALKQSIAKDSTGLFFKNGSQESLTEVMKNVVSGHPAKYLEMKNNVRSFVAKEYSMDKIIDRYKELLNDCLGC